ncbi:hypothetical protein [Anthocerotibacter panamensis]|uniref:hypothetical protein n=1 Tax=Anthocerotibacter panamensis TaxID=2857077 RepID=UPI001C404325|nr:hypothetical protein [Anthocerotibacter panamensis]
MQQLVQDKKKIRLTGTLCTDTEPKLPRFLQLETTEGQVWIKLAKRYREDLPRLGQGVSLRVQGAWRSDDTGFSYFKVKELDVLCAPLRVEVCTKGNCRRGGALALMDKIQREHPDWEVAATGCLHACQSSKCGVNVKVCGLVLKGLGTDTAEARITKVAVSP